MSLFHWAGPMLSMTLYSQEREHLGKPEGEPDALMLARPTGAASMQKQSKYEYDLLGFVVQVNIRSTLSRE